MSEPCLPCEQHAKMHSIFSSEYVPTDGPCGQCEQHAQMHSMGSGCAMIAMMLTATAALVGGVVRNGRRKR